MSLNLGTIQIPINAATFDLIDVWGYTLIYAKRFFKLQSEWMETFRKDKTDFKGKAAQASYQFINPKENEIGSFRKKAYQFRPKKDERISTGAHVFIKNTIENEPLANGKKKQSLEGWHHFFEKANKKSWKLFALEKRCLRKGWPDLRFVW